MIRNQKPNLPPHKRPKARPVVTVDGDTFQVWAMGALMSEHAAFECALAESRRLGHERQAYVTRASDGKTVATTEAARGFAWLHGLHLGAQAGTPQ